MAKAKESHSEMAHARQSDGISVIFDQKSPASSHSRSRSRSGCDSNRSSSSGRYRGRGSHRGRYRSSSSSTSSSSSSRSSSNPRSRSHPRCHRRSSRCRCDNHRRYGSRRYRRSPPSHYRAHSRSYSRSPSPDRYSHHRRHRSHYRSRSRLSSSRLSSSRLSSSRLSSSRLSSHQSRHRRTERPSPRSPSRSHRSHSSSKSSGHSISLTPNDKKELLQTAKANAMKILGTEKLELPESVQPILSEQSVESKQMSPEPVSRVRQDPEKTPSQNSEEEPDDLASPKMSPKRRIISFSLNNSVVKPIVAAPSCAKVTPRVDLYESRKPYGHWIPVKSGQTSNTRKHTLALSR